MRVLVTGASGFVGGHVVERLLADGDEVRALVRPTSDLAHLRGLPVALAFGDLGSPEAAAAVEGVDVVVHAAARVVEHGTRADFWDANVGGTAHLLEAARRRGVRRFVFVSSPSVVAEDADQLGIDEAYPYPARPLNRYCETKAEAERRVLAADAPGFRTVALRPRGVWGPRDRTGYLPKLLARLRDGGLPDLSGGRDVAVTVCHARNAAHATALAARAPDVGGRAYFVHDGLVTHLWPFLRELAALFDVPPPRGRLDPRVFRALARLVDRTWRATGLLDRRDPPLSRYGAALLTRSSTYDLAAARRDLGYAPVVGRDEGLAELKAWVDAIGGLDAFTRWVDGR